jgi:hypothetical protein
MLMVYYNQQLTYNAQNTKNKAINKGGFVIARILFLSIGLSNQLYNSDIIRTYPITPNNQFIQPTLYTSDLSRYSAFYESLNEDPVYNDSLASIEIPRFQLPKRLYYEEIEVITTEDSPKKYKKICCGTLCCLGIIVPCCCCLICHHI